MNTILSITILILICSLSFAQLQWQESGVPVRQGENIVWNQASVACDDETFVSIWTDTRNGIRGVYAQKVDINGNTLWGENGIEIFQDNSMQDHPIAISSNDNTVIVCWKDYDAIDVYSSQIRVQKIDANGNLLWGEEGILLEESGANGGNPQMVKHSDSGVFIIWNETPQSDIKGIRLLADGSIADGWGEGIDLLPAMYEYDTHSDLMDGVILSTSLYDDIYIQRVDENGNKLWGFNGTPLYNGNYYYNCFEMDICSSIIGEYYFSWQTYEQNSVHEIMIQKVDSTGNPIWDSPIIITEEYAFRFITICPLDSQPIVTWIINETIFSQKIDSDGNFLWGDEGITVFESDEYVNSNTIILKEDIANGCILTWEDYRQNDDNRILVQRINSSGDLLFDDVGLTIFETPNGYSFSPSLARLEQRYYLNWLVNTDDSQSLMQQIIDEDGNIYLEENGEEMFSGLSGSVYDIQMISDGDNPIMLWLDNRNMNDSQIRIQILNDDGTNIFSEDGIPITTDSQHDQEDLVAVFGENSETIAVIWSDNRTGCSQIFAQGIDTSGNLLWADSTGISLSSPDYYSEKPKVSIIDNYGTDEFFVGWEDYSDFMDTQIVGQKVIDGNLEWGTSGKVIVDREGNDELTDIVEDYYLWQSVGYNNENIFCLRVDENGDPAPGWSEDGLEVCVEDGRQRGAKTVVVPDGILIVWSDFRNGDCNIYGQIVTPDGNTLWQEGGIPLIAAYNIDNFDVLYNEGIYLVWSDNRIAYQMNYFMQKFDEDGGAFWQDDGVQISYFNFAGRSEAKLASVEQDVLVVWEHRYEDQDSHIEAQLVSPNGDLQYGLTGLDICNQYMDQEDPQVYVNGTDAYICWKDGRSTIMGDEGLMQIYGIYAQKVHIDPTFADDEIVKPVEILSNYPNPFNPNTTISFTLNTENTENTEINIYNIRGQKIRTLECINCFDAKATESLSHNSVVWNVTDQNNQPVASGIYFYQLNIDDEIIASKKCLLLK